MKIPLLAQLAVTMTQMMTDLTADATVLTRGDQIVAFSGELPLDEFRALRRADRRRLDRRKQHIPHSLHHAAGEPGGITCSTRAASVAELYLDDCLQRRAAAARHPAAGRSHAAGIGQRPGRSDAPAEAAPPEAESRQPFAFVWLVDDPARLLRKQVAEQLVFWLEVQLNSLNWKIHRLDVHHDFIYLRADVPGRASPDALVRTVMDRARADRLLGRPGPAPRALGGCLPRAAAGARHERTGIAALPAIRPRLTRPV